MKDETVQIQPSMFPEVVPSKLDIVVPYYIEHIANYRVSDLDNGRNVAAVSCKNQWPISGAGMAWCKGKNSIYHYQWMTPGNVARCSKCGCIWMYDQNVYNAAYRTRHIGNDGIDPQYPLIDTE